MFELALAFEPGVELLARVMVATSIAFQVAASIRFQEVPATVGEHHGHITPAVQSDGLDQSLFAQVSKVAVPRISGAVEVVAELARRHDAKGADG